MTESPDAQRHEDGAEQAPVAELGSRLTLLEQRIGSGAERPWWQRFEFIGPISATLITAIVSLTTVVVQNIAKDRELKVSAIRQQALINQNYLDRAIEVHDDASKREFALEFYSKVVQDPSVRDWAIGQLNIMRAQREAEEARQHQQQLEATYAEASLEERERLSASLENASQKAANLETRARDAQRIATINSLVAPDHQTRWQAAEDLSTVWGTDQNLPTDLLRFISERSDDGLAIYNVVVVTEDLVKCCREVLDVATIEQILAVAAANGGPKTQAKVQQMREAVGE